MQQLTQRQRPHMRRITQYSPTILISGPRGMFAAINIFHQHGTASAAHASHCANQFRGLLHVMQSQAAHHNIELAFVEGQSLRIAHAKRNIFHAMFFGSSTGNRQHFFRQIHSQNFARFICKGLRDVSRPSCNVQNTFRAGKPRSGNQPRDALFIGNPRIGSESRRLRGERFANNFVMRERHTSSLSAGDKTMPSRNSTSGGHL
jgi:hypothetical protein